MYGFEIRIKLLLASYIKDNMILKKNIYFQQLNNVI